MTSVKAYLHTTIAAMAIAVGALLSAPAQANIALPGGPMYIPGPLDFPGFGIGNANGHASGANSSFSISPCGFAPCINPINFGLNGAPRGANINRPDFGVSTPWGGFSGPGFGINPAYAFGMNGQQSLSVRTPWGGVSIPGFGVGMHCGFFVNPCTLNPLSFGVAGPQQALSVSTPWGGFSGPGFGLMPFLPPGFGISTPWGGMNMGGFGIGGQQPQIMPIYMPYPY